MEEKKEQRVSFEDILRDRKQLEELYRTCEKYLRRILIKRGAPRLQQEEFDDIIGAAMEKLTAALLKGTFRGECKLTTFLYPIVYNAWADAARKGLKKKVTLSNKISDNTADNRENVVTRFEEKELREMLRKAVDKLAGTKKRVGQLVILGGMTQTDAAKLLKINQSTISEHVEDIKRYLKTELKDFYSKGESDEN